MTCLNMLNVMESMFQTYWATMDNQQNSILMYFADGRIVTHLHMLNGMES